MTEVRPTPKTRSAFLPIMLVVMGLVIVAGAVVAFVPLVECNGCFGAGYISWSEFEQLFPNIGIQIVLEPAWSCVWCVSTGQITVWRKVTENPPDDDRHLSQKYSGVRNLENRVQEIIARRSSTP